MGGEHDHGTGLARAGERHKGRLLAAFVIIGTFFIVEAVAGVWTNSLALLSDAGHMLTDVIGIGMALAAIQLASRFEHRSSTSLSAHTFGLYRLEILAAFGVGSSAKVAAWQTGVRWLEDAKTDLFAFTLDKTGGTFSPTTRYRDYAISRELIHWESQSATRADSEITTIARNDVPTAFCAG